MADQVIINVSVPDSELEQAVKNVDKLTDSMTQYSRENKKLQKENKKLEAQLEDLNEEREKGTLSLEDYTKKEKALTSDISRNTKAIEINKAQIKTERSERSASLRLISTEAGSRDQLRAKISLLTKEYNSINETTEEGAARAIELQNTLAELNETINQGSLASNNYKDNIGNYSSALDGASFNTSKLLDDLEDMPGATGGAAGGVRALGAQFKKLLLNPIVLLIAAIVAGLAALRAAFLRSEKGSKLLDRAMAGLDGIFSAFVKLIEPLVDALDLLFSNSEKAAKALGDALENDLYRRVAGITEAFSGLGTVISGVFSFDSEEIKKGLEDVGRALITITTGLSKEDQKNLNDALSDFKDNAEKTTIALTALEGARQRAFKTNLALTKQIEELTTKEEQYLMVADDATISLQKQQKANEEALSISVERAEKQIELAKINLNLINTEVAIRKRNDEAIDGLLTKQLAGFTELEAAERELLRITFESAKQKRQIRQDYEEQSLDFLIDAFDNQKTINERIISNDKLTLDARRALLNETVSLSNKSFNKQIETLQMFTNETINANDLITESDAVVLREKVASLELSEILTTRLLEVIRDRKTAEQDFAELSTELTNEETERKTKAIADLKAIEDAYRVSQLSSEQEQKAALIEIEKEKTALLLENETLLQEERALIIAEGEQAIRDIEKEFRAAKETDIETSFENIINLSKEFLSEESKVFSELTKELAEFAAKTETTWQNTANVITGVTRFISDTTISEQDRQLEALEAAKEYELALAGESGEKRTEIERKYNNEKSNILKKQFAVKKAQAVFEIAINTAIAVTEVLANPILAAIVGGLGAIQAGIVLAQSPPPVATFAKGGTIVQGGSHASGNDVTVYGDNGQVFGKVQGGEMMAVMNRESTQALMMSNLNKAYGGNSFMSTTPSSKQKTFEAGGNLDVNTWVQNAAISTEQLKEALASLNISVKVEDITTAINKQAVVINNATI